MNRDNWTITRDYGFWIATHKHAERSYSYGDAGDVDAPVTLIDDTADGLIAQIDEWEQEHAE